MPSSASAAGVPSLGAGARGFRIFLQAIAQPAHGGDADAADLDFFAQPVHIHLDGVVADLLAPFAQVIDQLFLGDQAAGARQQDFQQAQLARRQVQHLVGDVGAAADLVVGQRTVFDDGGAAAGAAPGQGPHPRLQLGQRERLGHVIVGAQVEAVDALLDRIGRRQDQHRQQRGTRAQAAQHLQPGHFGQAQVQDQQVEFLGRQGGVGLLAVADAIDGVARLAQRAGQSVCQDAIIFGK
jgi:hypothetical protein